MAAYLILSILPVMLMPVINTMAQKSLNSSPNTKRWFLFICGVLLFLSLALRHKGVGSEDSLSYYNTWRQLVNMGFDNVKAFAEDSKMETGFIYTIWIFTKVFVKPQYIFVITGAIYTFAVCNFIYRNSMDVLMSYVMFVTLGLYEFMFQCMRQAIAMSICLLAFELCKKRKLILFILVVLLARTYHQTALVFLVVYPLYGIAINGLTVISALSVSAVLVALSPTLLVMANRWFEREYYGTAQGGGFIALLLYVIIIIVALIFKYQVKTDKNFEFFFFVTLLGAVIFFMRYTGVRIAERISFYFMFAQMVTLPNTVQYLDVKSRHTAKIVILLLCIVLYIYRLTGSVMVPYKFFWQ